MPQHTRPAKGFARSNSSFVILGHAGSSANSETSKLLGRAVQFGKTKSSTPFASAAGKGGSGTFLNRSSPHVFCLASLSLAFGCCFGSLVHNLSSAARVNAYFRVVLEAVHKIPVSREARQCNADRLHSMYELHTTPCQRLGQQSPDLIHCQEPRWSNLNAHQCRACILHRQTFRRCITVPHIDEDRSRHAAQLIHCGNKESWHCC